MPDVKNRVKVNRNCEKVKDVENMEEECVGKDINESVCPC